jgi:hypothetical protein
MKFKTPAIFLSATMCFAVATSIPSSSRAQTTSIDQPSSNPATKKCAPTLVFKDTLQTPSYDPFAASPLVSDTDIEFSNLDCNEAVAIIASFGWGGRSPLLTFNGNELAFSLFVAGRDLTLSDGGLSNGSVALGGAQIEVPPVASGTLPNLVRLVIREGQVVPAGLYALEAPIETQISDEVLSRGLSLDPESRSEIGANILRISAQVLPVLKLAITGCDVATVSDARLSYDAGSTDLASSCKLTLGDTQTGMTSGDSARARLTSFTNVNFVIAMTSRNGGILTPLGKSSPVEEIEQIRYTASLQGQGEEYTFMCSPASCGRSQIFEPSASLLGTDLYFQVKVIEPDLTQKRAGNYSDIITLIIQPAS